MSQAFYQKSLLYGKANNSPQHIKLRHVNHLQGAGILEHDVEVYLDLYDAAGSYLGPIKSAQNILLGADGSLAGTKFALQYVD